MSLEPANRPWLDQKKWAVNRIPSDAHGAHWVLWGFALIWNLLTLPIFIQFESLWQKAQREPLTFIILLFPLVGLFLLAAAVQASRKRRLFGATPLVLDPFPGSLGGHVGGSIETGIPFDPSRHFPVSLSCVYSRISGAGKNRKRSESIEWRSDGACHTERSLRGSKLSFRFDVPTDLPASDIQAAGNYYFWRVRVRADLDGPDFDRCYQVPVFETGARRSAIRQGTESHPATMDAATAGVETVADIQAVPGGIEIRFPALQRPAQGILTLVFGLVFAGIGIGVGIYGDALLLASVFTLVGGIIASYGAYYLGKSLTVSVSPEGVGSRRFLFGYPLTSRRLVAANFREFEIKQGATMQSGNKTTVFYQLLASGDGSKPFTVAERLTSRAEVELLKETYQAYLGRY